MDGNKLNNSLSNLQWGTRSENAKDKTRHGTQAKNLRQDEFKGSKHYCASMTEDQLYGLRVRYYRGEATAPELAREVGIASTPMWRALTGRKWTHVPMPPEYYEVNNG